MWRTLDGYSAASRQRDTCTLYQDELDAMRQYPTSMKGKMARNKLNTMIVNDVAMFKQMQREIRAKNAITNICVVQVLHQSVLTEMGVRAIEQGISMNASSQTNAFGSIEMPMQDRAGPTLMDVLKNCSSVAAGALSAATFAPVTRRGSCLGTSAVSPSLKFGPGTAARHVPSRRGSMCTTGYPTKNFFSSEAKATPDFPNGIIPHTNIFTNRDQPEGNGTTHRMNHDGGQGDHSQTSSSQKDCLNAVLYQAVSIAGESGGFQQTGVNDKGLSVSSEATDSSDKMGSLVVDFGRGSRGQTDDDDGNVRDSKILESSRPAHQVEERGMEKFESIKDPPATEEKKVAAPLEKYHKLLLDEEKRSSKQSPPRRNSFSGDKNLAMNDEASTTRARGGSSDFQKYETRARPRRNSLSGLSNQNDHHNSLCDEKKSDEQSGEKDVLVKKETGPSQGSSLLESIVGSITIDKIKGNSSLGVEESAPAKPEKSSRRRLPRRKSLTGLASTYDKLSAMHGERRNFTKSAEDESNQNEIRPRRRNSLSGNVDGDRTEESRAEGVESKVVVVNQTSKLKPEEVPSKNEISKKRTLPRRKSLSELSSIYDKLNGMSGGAKKDSETTEHSGSEKKEKTEVKRRNSSGSAVGDRRKVVPSEKDIAVDTERERELSDKQSKRHSRPRRNSLSGISTKHGKLNALYGEKKSTSEPTESLPIENGKGRSSVVGEAIAREKASSEGDMSVEADNQMQSMKDAEKNILTTTRINDKIKKRTFPRRKSLSELSSIYDKLNAMTDEKKNQQDSADQGVPIKQESAPRRRKSLSGKAGEICEKQRADEGKNTVAQQDDTSDTGGDGESIVSAKNEKKSRRTRARRKSLSGISSKVEEQNACNDEKKVKAEPAPNDGKKYAQDGESTKVNEKATRRKHQRSNSMSGSIVSLACDAAPKSIEEKRNSVSSEKEKASKKAHDEGSIKSSKTSRRKPRRRNSISGSMTSDTRDALAPSSQEGKNPEYSEKESVCKKDQDDGSVKSRKPSRRKHKRSNSISGSMTSDKGEVAPTSSEERNVSEASEKDKNSKTDKNSRRKPRRRNSISGSTTSKTVISTEETNAMACDKSDGTKVTRQKQTEKDTENAGKTTALPRNGDSCGKFSTSARRLQLSNKALLTNGEGTQSVAPSDEGSARILKAGRRSHRRSSMAAGPATDTQAPVRRPRGRRNSMMLQGAAGLIESQFQVM